MTKIINLNKAKKARDLTAQKTRADENAARFGRTKAARLADAARDAQTRARLDQLKFEDE